MFYTLSLLLLVTHCQAAGRSKPITTSLDAKWPAHSVALEISEFLAEKSNDDFWSYVDVLRHLTDSKWGTTTEYSSHHHPGGHYHWKVVQGCAAVMTPFF